MRLHYRYKEASGYFHTLRAVMRNPEEDGKGNEEMKLLSDNFLSAYKPKWNWGQYIPLLTE